MPPRAQPLPDRPRHDVARRQLGLRMLVHHEALSELVEQHRAFAAQRLGQQRQRIVVDRQSRGMELDELDIHQPALPPGSHRQAVAGRLGRIGGVR